MPYDPRMQGGPPAPARWWEQPQAPQGVQFAAPPPPQQPKQWYDQAVQVGQPANRPVNTPDDRTDAQRKQPPSLIDMAMNLGRMSRPEYDKAIAGQGGYGVSPRDAARVSPWAFLGSMGMPGGPGWGGGKP